MRNQICFGFEWRAEPTVYNSTHSRIKTEQKKQQQEA